jgi:acetyl esterase/lipase
MQYCPDRPYVIRHFGFFVILFACLITMTSAAPQTLTFKNILDRPDRPRPNLKVAYGTHADQYAELWLPTTDKKVPVVILIHGGCWRADLPGPELVAFLADDLRNNGVAVLSITYRRIGSINTSTKPSAQSETASFSPYPGTFNDVAAATEKLRELAEPHRLDLTRIVATGHSAGGHLAMWLAARHRLPADSILYHAKPLPIQTAIGIAAMPDLAYAKAASAHACGADTVDLLVNSKERKDAYRDTSITPLLPLGVKQILISGVYDAIVAPAQALRHRERAKDKQETVTLLTLDNAGHFELIAPWTPPGRQVVETIIQQAMTAR